MARALFVLILLFLVPAPVLADGASAAIDIVEDFHQEANTMIKAAGLAALPEDSRAAALKRLGEVRFTEEAGRRRSARITEIVRGYMDSAVRHAEAADAVADPARREELLVNMKAAVKAHTLRLTKALAADQPATKTPSHAPSFDLSPFDEPPGPDEGAPGILYR